MDNILAVRPKLKQNSLVIQTGSGLFVKGETTDFHIKGTSIARWVAALWPYMTGAYTTEQLCARLKPDQREHVTRIISVLLAKGILKNALPEAPQTLPEEVANQFQTQIEYIDHFVDAPRQHFKRFRHSSLLLYGSGETLKALALSLLRNGLQELSLCTPDLSEHYLADLEQEVAAIRAGGSEVRVSLLPRAPSVAALDLVGAEIVVYCADRASFTDLSTLNQRCVREGQRFLATTPFAGRMMLGPLVQPGAGPCWLCAMMRLATNSDERTQATLWRNLLLGESTWQEATPFLPVARQIGYGLGFELFKILSGCLPSEVEQGMIVQNLQTLESTHNRIVQHPCCTVCARGTPELAQQQLHDVVAGKRDQELSDYELYERHLHLVDPRTGVFREFTDSEVEQLPLKRAHLTGRYLQTAGCEELSATAFSLTTSLAARTLALKHALSAYTASVPQMRNCRLASQQELAEQGLTAICPQELATWSGLMAPGRGSRCEWLPAFSLGSNGPVYVPAAAVYPHSSLNHLGVFARTTAGAAVASTFASTLTCGLLDALAYEHLQEWLHGRGTHAPLDPTSLSGPDPDLHFLLQSARRYQRTFALTVIGSALPLAVVLAHTTDAKERILATGLELAARDSLKAALTQLVGALQVQESGGRLTADQQDAGCACSLAGIYLPTDESGHRQAPEQESEIAQVQQALLQTGRDILFVHTTSTDLWDTGTLIAGRVLLTRPAAQ